MTAPARRALELAGLAFIVVLALPLLAGRSFRLTGDRVPATGLGSWLGFALPTGALVFVVVFAVSYSWSLWQYRHRMPTRPSTPSGEEP